MTQIDNWQFFFLSNWCGNLKSNIEKFYKAVHCFAVWLLFKESREILIGILGEFWPEKPDDFEFHYRIVALKKFQQELTDIISSWNLLNLRSRRQWNSSIFQLNRNFRSKKDPAFLNMYVVITISFSNVKKTEFL